MELFFFTRGIKNRKDEMTNDLQAQWFPRKYNGKMIESQGSLKPVEFWGYTFPEPCLQEVLKMINPLPNDYCPSLDKYGFILRKALGAKKIPPIDTNIKIPLRLIRKKFVQVWGIGLKEDKFNEKGEEML